MKKKPNLSFWALWNLSFGFFGVQIAYALQSGNISRIFRTLGADPHTLSFFWILPPLMGIPVQPSIAMTGEVSLQGDVKPIGGLPEKLMAAQRAGVKRVFIPEDNLDDLREVAQEVRDALEITPVRDVEELLGHLGIHPKEPTQIAS